MLQEEERHLGSNNSTISNGHGSRHSINCMDAHQEDLYSWMAKQQEFVKETAPDVPQPWVSLDSGFFAKGHSHQSCCRVEFDTDNVVNVNYLGGNGPKSPGVKNLGGWVDGSSIGSITVKIGKELPEKLKNSFSCFYNNLLEYLQLLWVVKMCLKNDRSIIKNYR